MSASTNKLVATTRRYAVPTAVATSAALGACLIFNSNGVHAASLYSSAPIDDSSVAALTSLDHAMETVAARVTPSVVNIAVTSRGNPEDAEQQGGPDGGQLQNLPPQLRQFFGGQFGGGQMQPQQPQVEHGIGSGVIISPDGYILTNNHVVNGATQISVTLYDRRIFTGKVIGTDKLTDLAVVKINAQNLPAISWGDSSKLEPGQTVLAFGSPFGYLKFSVTRGIVSAINRDNPNREDARTPGGIIQTDAAINPGNSGGPLVNAHGELIGINYLIATNSGSFAGAGFAIPSGTARNVSQQIIAHGKVEHGYLGISMNDVTPDNAHFFNLKDAAGAIVAQVTPDSPAARAGLQQGDVITQLNGARLLNGQALQVAVSETQPGTSISVGILRDGKPQTLKLTVGQYAGKGTQLAETDSPDGTQAKPGKLGLAVANLDQDTRSQLQLPATVHGVVIAQVRPDSPADNAGLQQGDVILEVNRHPVTSADSFVSSVRGTSPSDQDLLLLVWSHGNASYRTLRTLPNQG